MKILIADDHSVVRQGLKQILKDEFPKVELGEAADSQSAIDLVWKQDWDFVILDIAMPGRSGLDVLKELKKARPKLPVLILSAHPEDQFAVRVLKAGAEGYMTKETATEELVKAVKKILAGGKYVSTQLAEKLASDLHSPTDGLPHERLSDREYQVLCMIGTGKMVKEIATDLSLSVKTISTYRTRILEKMKVRTNAEIVQYVVQHGLVPRQEP
jgi:DNA-binding NarL/FixJ family response regulator